QALAHAARVRADAVVGDLLELDPLKRLGDPLLALDGRHADETRGVAQIVGGAEMVVEADLIRQVTNAALHGERLARRGVPEHPCLARRYVGQTQQHEDGGRLAGPVGTQQPQDFPGRDGERNAVDGRRRAIALGEVPRLDDTCAHRRPNLATAPTITRSATPMMPTPTMPHMVEVVTVMRKFDEADSPR